MSQTDYLFVSDLPQDYICQICMKVLHEPHATECCGQHYCKACLEKWFGKNKGDKVCPHCREADFVHILYKPLQRKINELQVHCSNSKLGCKVILKLEELDSHLSVSNPSGCGHVLIPCQNGCGQKLLRVDMDYHVVGECTRREETCSHCDMKMSHDFLADHYKICEEMEVNCPRNCGREICRGDLKTHEDECPDMPVKCPFVDAGCQVELTKKGLEEHVEKGTTAHLMILMAGYNTLKTDNDHLKADVESLKDENESLKKESETSKREFKNFKSQIAVEIERVNDIIEAPNSKISQSLECIGSSLRGYHLKSVADKIMFSVPMSTETWQSPPFLVHLSYIMCVVVYERAVELLLLKGDADGQLKWLADIKKSITLTLYSKPGSSRLGASRTDLLLKELVSQEKVVPFEYSLNRWKDQESIGTLYVYDRPLYIGVREVMVDPERVYVIQEEGQSLPLPLPRARRVYQSENKFYRPGKPAKSAK